MTSNIVPILLLSGLATGVAIAVSKSMDKKTPSTPGKTKDIFPVDKSGHIVGCNTGSSTPNATGDAPKGGFASNPFYQWCWVLAAGESPGDVAARVVGNSARYVDLIMSNPEIPTQGTPGVFTGPSTYNFLDGSLTEGMLLKIPSGWNSHVDQLGKPRGKVEPFPIDIAILPVAPIEESAPTYFDTTDTYSPSSPSF